MVGAFDPSLTIYISCHLNRGTVATDSHKLTEEVQQDCTVSPAHPLVGVEAWSALLFTFSLERGGFRGPLRELDVCSQQVGNTTM